MTLRIPRRTYADLYGPTTGDRVRLADTELIVEVEKDFTVYGDEITFGGGKVIRDGMGQSSEARREDSPGALDLVITNALIIDHWWGHWSSDRDKCDDLQPGRLEPRTHARSRRALAHELWFPGERERRDAAA